MAAEVENQRLVGAVTTRAQVSGGKSQIFREIIDSIINSTSFIMWPGMVP